uniref:Uncharacterized protein n=1 Tax=Oryzias latipes TaxID=8090 RepID=A0A3P9LCZ9_ORYLA
MLLTGVKKKYHWRFQVLNARAQVSIDLSDITLELYCIFNLSMRFMKLSVIRLREWSQSRTP